MNRKVVFWVLSDALLIVALALFAGAIAAIGGLPISNSAYEAISFLAVAFGSVVVGWLYQARFAPQDFWSSIQLVFYTGSLAIAVSIASLIIALLAGVQIPSMEPSQFWVVVVLGLLAVAKAWAFITVPFVLGGWLKRRAYGR